MKNSILKITRIFLVHFNFSTFFFTRKSETVSTTILGQILMQRQSNLLTMFWHFQLRSPINLLQSRDFCDFLFSLFSARDLFSADLHLTIFQRRLMMREKYTRWDGKSSKFSLLHTLFLLHNLSVDLLWVEIAEWVRENEMFTRDRLAAVLDNWSSRRVRFPPLSRCAVSHSLAYRSTSSISFLCTQQIFVF